MKYIILIALCVLSLISVLIFVPLELTTIDPTINCINNKTEGVCVNCYSSFKN